MKEYQTANRTTLKVRFGNDTYVTDMVENLSRATIKSLGARMISQTGEYDTELRMQLWQLVTVGSVTYWIGDDWYSDSFARVYLAHLAPF